MKFPQKIKNRTIVPYDPEILLQSIQAEEFKAKFQKDIHTPMFLAVLFIIIKCRNKCPLKDEQINKMCCIEKVECYSASKSKKILSCATTQMKLDDIIPLFFEDIILSKIILYNI